MAEPIDLAEPVTTHEQRSKALYVAIRAFQAALAIEGADEVHDYLALCELLGEALDEYGDGLDGSLPPSGPVQ